jgi:uncharacterized membrane protein YidH (DUF202 family)
MDNQPLVEPISAEKQEKKSKKKAFNLERTRMAMERLQLAWVRMTITLMAIGFTIYKVLESVMEERGRPLILGFISGREIGLAMLLSGLFGLTLATRQHVTYVGRLKEAYPEMPRSIALIHSYLILGLTLFLLVAVLFRL